MKLAKRDRNLGAETLPRGSDVYSEERNVNDDERAAIACPYQ